MLSVFVLGAMAGEARADAPAGEPALHQARAAWDRGAFGAAEPLYREAIEKGGLAPNEVLEGYVRLGSIRASLGKKDSATAAFRAASILDADFSVPKEAGTAGARLAERAKKDMAKIGSIELTIEAPKELEAGKPFTVTATLDKAHVPIISKIGLLAKDGTSGKELALEEPTGETVTFEVSADVALPGASLVVRVDALDKQQNRLASAEARARVPGEASPPKIAGGAGDTSGWLGKRPPDKRASGFWSSPWPYVLGGVALAGAGTAVFFGTRPSENVSVGPIGIRTH